MPQKYLKNKLSEIKPDSGDIPLIEISTLICPLFHKGCCIDNLYNWVTLTSGLHEKTKHSYLIEWGLFYDTAEVLMLMKSVRAKLHQQNFDLTYMQQVIEKKRKD